MTVHFMFILSGCILESYAYTTHTHTPIHLHELITTPNVRLFFYLLSSIPCISILSSTWNGTKDNTTTAAVYVKQLLASEDVKHLNIFCFFMLWKVNGKQWKKVEWKMQRVRETENERNGRWNSSFLFFSLFQCWDEFSIFFFWTLFPTTILLIVSEKLIGNEKCVDF